MTRRNSKLPMHGGFVVMLMVLAGLLPAYQGSAQAPEAETDPQATELELPALDDPPLPDAVLDEAETDVLDVGEEPLALEEIVVTGERFSLEQETALRIVRQALNEHRSYKREDRNKWRCWYRRPAGSHFTYMECARNGDLNFLALEPSYPRLGQKGDPVYGRIYRSQRPVNKKKFEALLESLPGSADLDREFVALSLAGQQPPRDIPSDAELDDFADAYRAINEQPDTSEAALIQLIEAEGLTLERYNRIVDLVETYQSIENEVAYRLGTLKRPEQ